MNMKMTGMILLLVMVIVLLQRSAGAEKEPSLQSFADNHALKGSWVDSSGKTHVAKYRPVDIPTFSPTKKQMQAMVEALNRREPVIVPPHIPPESKRYDSDANNSLQLLAQVLGVLTLLLLILLPKKNP